MQRVLLGALAAVGIALAARRSGTLSVDGACAAVGVGTISVAAGWDWAAALIAFFLSSSIWSHIGRARKEAFTAGVVSKGGERDALQVLANGGVFTLCALGYVVWSLRNMGGLRDVGGVWTEGAWRAVAGGALAAASSDTWATEAGTLWGGQPRSILTGRPVVRGMSGGVTALGTLAGVAGAVALAGLLSVLGWGWSVASAAFAGGVAGMGIDSLLGATGQQRRWCERCKAFTERDVHSCSTPTRAAGGLSWLDNDGVNALSTLAGAWIAVVLYRSLS